MNLQVKYTALTAGYTEPELSGRLQSFADLLVTDIIHQLTSLHLTQAINNQNHPADWHDGIDACIDMVKEEYGGNDG